MVDLLYISTLCSEKVIDQINQTAKVQTEFAAQKFHRLLAEGFNANPGKCRLHMLSTVPVVHYGNRRKFWFLKKEKEDGFLRRYVPVINLPIVKNIGVFIFVFFYVIFWSAFKKSRNGHYIICDILNLSASSAALMASKLVGSRIVAIVTDLPGMMVTNPANRENKASAKLYLKVNRYVLHRFHGYILLTAQMNAVINPRGVPYLVMEGMVDQKMQLAQNILDDKYKSKVVMYAGGLYAKYGVELLVKAFTKIKNPQIGLHLYGNGDYVDKIIAFSERDGRIKYFGMVPNHHVVAEELKATLLVNPRPTHEEFTKYSFPSKNMEYLASGTPMLTTKLPGMPEEYLDHVYLFDEESVDGFQNVLNSLLAQSSVQLHEFGLRAKEFVMKNKTNVSQAGRVLNFLSSLN